MTLAVAEQGRLIGRAYHVSPQPRIVRPNLFQSVQLAAEVAPQIVASEVSLATHKVVFEAGKVRDRVAGSFARDVLVDGAISEAWNAVRSGDEYRIDRVKRHVYELHGARAELAKTIVDFLDIF